MPNLDIVLCINELLKTSKPVAYIDFDLHHGDGVEKAFYWSDRVMTVSVHHEAPGFFPGTGKSDDRGAGRGLGTALNIPLKRGASDRTLRDFALPKIIEALKSFSPSTLVIQCGADGLAGDPHKIFNYSSLGIVNTIKELIQSINVPCVLLGGGGYHHGNTARLWTALTMMAINLTSNQENVSIDENIEQLPHSIPADLIDEFGPYFDFAVASSETVPDENIT